MRGIRICRILGIDIEIHWSWLLILTLFSWTLAAVFLPDKVAGQPKALYWLAGLVVAFAAFLCVLVHELAHSVVSKRFGTNITSITLFFLGGAANLEGNVKSAKGEFLIAVAGPFSSLIIAGLFNGLSILDTNAPKLVLAGFSYLALFNLAVAVFNLLPMFPMDGGRVFRAIFWWYSGNLLHATKIMAIVAIVTGIMVVGALIFLKAGISNIIFFVLVLWFIVVPGGRAEYQQILIQKRLTGIKIRDLMTELPRYRRESLNHFYECKLDEDVLVVMPRIMNSSLLFVKDGDDVVGLISSVEVRNYLNNKERTRI